MFLYTSILVSGDKKEIIQNELEKLVINMAEKIPKKTRIGIDNLQDDTSLNDVTDFLMTAVTAKGYVAFDRRSLDDILKQQGFELKPFFDQESVKAIGEIKGVDAIIYGIVKNYSNSRGRIKINIHLQCTYLETGDTPWAYDLVVENTSSARKLVLYSTIAGILLLIFFIGMGIKNSGKTRILNKS